MVEIKKSGDSLIIEIDDLDKAVTWPWFCREHERLELPDGEVKCPECNTKAIRSSRCAWALTDALQEELEALDVEFHLVQEVPIPSKWDFNYHIDIGVWIRNRTSGVSGFAIDTNPPTNDWQKIKQETADEVLNEYGIFYRTVSKAKCDKECVHGTARLLVDELVDRASL
jgi:hypothetical protein